MGIFWFKLNAFALFLYELEGENLLSIVVCFSTDLRFHHQMENTLSGASPACAARVALGLTVQLRLPH